VSASLFSATTVNANYPATMVVAASFPPQSCLLFNNDPSNTIWLGDNNAFQAGDPNHAAPLGPLSSVTFDGTKDVYASTIAGQTALLDTYPTGSSYSQGNGIIQLAQQGTVTGTPAALIVPGTGFPVLSLVNVSGFVSYDINAYMFSQSPGAAGSVVSGQIQLQWFDDLTSGIPVFEEEWYIWSGRAAPVAGVNTLSGCGPMHGRYMSVNIFVPPGAAADAVLQYINLFGSNRTVPSSDWRQNAGQVNPQISGLVIVPGGTLSFENILCDVAGFVVTANTVNFIPLGLYSGPVFVRYSQSAAAGQVALIASANAVVGGQLVPGPACPGIIWFNSANAVGEAEPTIMLPRAPCLLIVKGPAASTISISVKVVAQQAA
jgi:hypothetical protein